MLSVIADSAFTRVSQPATNRNTKQLGHCKAVNAQVVANGAWADETQNMRNKQVLVLFGVIGERLWLGLSDSAIFHLQGMGVGRKAD
jgi:hypothetical protein